MEELQEEIKRLTEEVEYYMGKCEMLEQIVESQREKEKAMHKIFMLQEAEIQKLKEEK